MDDPIIWGVIAQRVIKLKAFGGADKVFQMAGTGTNLAAAGHINRRTHLHAGGLCEIFNAGEIDI